MGIVTYTFGRSKPSIHKEASVEGSKKYTLAEACG